MTSTRPQKRPRKRPLVRLSSLLAALLITSAILAGCGGPERGRVLILGLDGMDPQTVDLLMSEGKLPNFARLRSEGAYGQVLCPKPLLSPILWTTIATGKGAADHGIGHFVARNPETGEELPVTSRLRRVKALWNMATEAGRKVATVGWWATWPPEDVGDGLIVSDHTAYHFLFEEGFTGGSDEAKTHPPELIDRLSPLLRRPADLTPAELARFVDVPTAELEAGGGAARIDFKEDLDHFRWALASALSYREIGLDLWRRESPDLQMVYIEGTDSTSHLFGHLFRAEGLAGELAQQQARYGRTVEEIYLFADEILGEFLEAADERTTVMVVSDHGFELGALHDDPTRTRDMRRVSERFHRERGILYLWGHEIRAGARLEDPHLLDVAPTALALLDLPVGGDMPGRVLEEAFVRAPEPQKIASWEGTGDERSANAGDPGSGETQEAMLEHLRGLGYLSSSQVDQSAEGDRNLAAIYFEAGRYRESARLYKKLIDQDPEDAALRTSLAGVLGTLERYDDAMKQLDAALELDPLNVEAYHNRAVLLERRGDAENAVADYRRAVRYRPSYEPSRRALERLVGTAEVGGPRTEAERRAEAMAQEASVAARKGDYARALELLDEAAVVAPRFALVQQYRSNVAYLMGDRAKAIEALEKGLELEPDNQLFRQNLERLRGSGG
ncbi:MAG: alkaline phosphatase family protein [Acidobacteriota bacterium]